MRAWKSLAINSVGSRVIPNPKGHLRINNLSVLNALLYVIEHGS